MLWTPEKPQPQLGKTLIKESDYIRGPKTLEVPRPIYDRGSMVGYQFEAVSIVDLLRYNPIYDPFLTAEGYYFDTAEWSRFISFVLNECCFPEGVLTGKPFVPELWQCAVYANLFCWKRETNNRRRYRECFIYVPRKNGKTVAFGSILTLYMFYCDTEKRGQLYAAAADIEQASLNFRHTIYMLETNPRLLNKLRQCRVHRSTRSFEHIDGAVFKVLSSIADTKHGLSPSFIYADEVHAHPNSELLDVLLTGTGARAQPLTVYTTTADYDRLSPCNNMRDKAESIATGKQLEPTYLPVIYEATLEDDYTDPEVWKRTNPCFGVSVNEDYFENLVRNATNNPVELNRLLRLHFNIKTRTETSWIPPHVWRHGNADESLTLLTVPQIKEWMAEHPNWFTIVSDPKFEISKAVDLYIQKWGRYWTWFIHTCQTLKDEECYLAYDNASVNDIASIGLWFPRQCVILHLGWCPAKSIYERSHEQGLPYDMWYQAGLINATEKDSVDESAVLDAIVGTSEYPGLLTYFRNCREVVFDNWNAHHVYKTLKEYGYPCRVYPQSFAGMNEPCKKIESLALDHMLFHGGGPVFEWMANNVVISLSRDGKQRPDKGKSAHKIDGIVAVMMAIGAWMYPEMETITEIRGLKDVRPDHG
jgi:phage terminase large subunit-like protein